MGEWVTVIVMLSLEPTASSGCGRLATSKVVLFNQRSKFSAAHLLGMSC